MGIYSDEIRDLEQKKRRATIETAQKDQAGYARSERQLLPEEHRNKSSKTTTVHTSAYRQILDHDFTSEAWIGRTEQKRKARKHINSNYKTVTGKKWSGLSSDEKGLRKKHFEARRSLSVKASGLVADLLTKLNQSENFGHEEDLDFLKNIMEMDRSVFEYSGEETDTSPTGADEAFLQKFEDNMPILHRASLLYESLFEEDSFPELEGEERTNLMAKLAYIKEVRSAYEDRIRIISSPYYVSLREKDFVGNAPENLEKLQKSKKESETLRAYAASVLRWKNRGLSVLKDGTLTDIEVGRAFLEEDIKSRKQLETPTSDKAVDGIIGKLGVTNVNSVLNDKSDFAEVGMAIKTARNWVYADLKKKVSKEEITNRLKEMQDLAEKEIKRIKEDPEKYRIEKEESYNKDFEKKKADNSKLKYRTVTKEDVDIELKKKENILSHLENVEKRFAKGEISPEVMKLWLDRGLQHDLRMGRKIYDGIVHQRYNMNREEDKPYREAISKSIENYFKNLQGGIVTVQNSHTSYIRKEDEGKVDDRKALYKTIEKYPDRLGILPDKCDFIHVIGGQASSNDVTTRAYVSAKYKYKSKVVELFMETVKELKTQDQVYFKIASKADNGRYGMDDLTIFFSEKVSAKDRKKILDTLYSKCNKDGNNLLDGKDMCVTGKKYKDGIALATEPSTAEMLNTLFLEDSKFNDNKRLRDAKLRDEKVGANFSFNTFITSMFCQSAIAANYMLGKREATDINVADKKTLGRIKEIFRQLCFLNGINLEVTL